MRDVVINRAVLGTAIGVPIVVALLISDGCEPPIPDRYTDLGNLKQMVMTVHHHKKVLAAPDGRIDLYGMVFEEFGFAEDGYNVEILWNSRVEKPRLSIQEVRAGDYTKFHWERAVADDVRGATGRTPLLWDPDPVGAYRLVGFSDGAVRQVPETEFGALFE